METKMVLLSGALALLMVSSGFVLMIDEINSDEDTTIDDEIQQDSNIVENTPPSLLIAEQFTHLWDGTNASIGGFILDEALDSTTVTLLLLDSNNLEQIGQPRNTTPASDGSWSITTERSQPGTWLIQIQATDAAGLTSNVSMSQLTILAPQEADVILSVLWILPEENSSIGTLQGLMLHVFPSTCSVEYHPLGQSPARLIDGDENLTTGEYSMFVNTSYHNTEGDLIASCGLYSESTSTIRLNLPVPPEPETDLDSDGVLDDADDCDSTPEGEPVYVTGCSDSETDDDLDARMNDKDMCPDTPVGEAVDGNGCSESQKDDDADSVNNVLDLCDNTPAGETVDADGCSDTQKDGDGDGVSDADDQCPNTPTGDVVGADGCTLPDWSAEESWYCQDGNGPWVRDDNGVGNNYNANTNGVSTPSGGGSGPWFQCEVSVTSSSTSMDVNSNGIPNHDWVSALGPGADEQTLTWSIPLNPTNDTNGGHTSTNCPAANGQWECAADRGQVAVATNGVPIFGPEEGPGGDAVALDFFYFTEDRQPIDLGYCGAHSGPTGVHYHWDAMCQYWEPESGQTMQDYDWSLIDSTKHSPIIGWSFDGYPIYGMYTWDDSGAVKGMKSSYEVERTSEGGDQGYNGIDDWNYVSGSGDLDQCNGRYGPTPEYPDGTYYYVSTPLSGSSSTVVDTNGDTVPMIGFPYFLLCYHGIADDSNAGGGQGGGGPPPGGNTAQTLYSHMPELFDSVEDRVDIQGLLWNTTWILLVVIGAAFVRGHRNND
ncbi:MAG: hypothetical protein ACI8T6_000050 [Candidatus Poseidoniaceae archaeon]|jgi:hypothetical protein